MKLCCIKSTIQMHLKSNKEGKEMPRTEKTKEMDLVKSLKLHDQEHHPVAEILPDSVRVIELESKLQC